MYTRLTPKREETKLCELKPGDTFMCPEFDADSTILMVVSSSPVDDITIYSEEGKIIGISLDEGELWTFEPDTLIYKVNGSFEGVY